MTAASPEPTDGSWAAPAGSGAAPASGDGTWSSADAPPPPPAPTGGSAASRPGPWATPPSGWQPPDARPRPGVPTADSGLDAGSGDTGNAGARGAQPVGPIGAPDLGVDAGSGDTGNAGSRGAEAAPPAGGDPSASGGWAAPTEHDGGVVVGPQDGWVGPRAPEPPALPLRQRLGAAGLTAVVVAVVGAPLGLLWALLAPGVPIIKTDDGAVFATPSPEEFIASDGWFTILLFVLGVLAALVTWIGFRRHRGPWTLAGLVVGTIGASILAWQVGRRIGIGDYHDRILAAKPGELITRPPDLRAGGFTKLWDVVPFVHGDLLIATFGAVIIYTLLAGWSRTPSLQREPQLPQPTPNNPFYVLGVPGSADTGLPAAPGVPGDDPGSGFPTAPNPPHHGPGDPGAPDGQQPRPTP
ncbi:DUF2567 domain-containing protein [Asanoa sp. WMMD1127]|uniref:DUF2567 domain-containing protein n=1 Tax=Asanoa sp. WMMD1127 TaxID=3016107 RepID=UPI002417629B|nr:DUF2567 domain-containing protein [Asanoa sp. WMMD1127]MDG4827056.1 DUF2567 domain-containing protein [Asanoa sp. WMMD1127]